MPARTGETEAFMSGPVWEYRADGSFTCEICLAETETAYVQGHVEDARFHTDRVLCEACFRNNIHLLQRAS